MRNLFICFLLATLVAVVQRGPSPVVEPATYLGILVAFPVLGARLFRNWRLPPAVGAIAAGIILNQSGLLSEANMVRVGPFKDVGLAWLGLFLGTQVARAPSWRGPSFVSALSIVIGSALLICGATAVFPLTLLERLQMALAGAVCAPIFTILERGRHRDEIGLTGLATLFAVGLLGVTVVVTHHEVLPPPIKMLYAGGVALVTTEIAFQSLKRSISGPGRYLAYILIVGALWRVSEQLGIHSAITGAAFGILLGLRARKRQDTTAPLLEASAFVGPFVLGFVTAEWDGRHLLGAPVEAWALGAAIILPMVLGKMAAGLVADRISRFGPRDWMTTYPIGIVAVEILPAVTPDHLFLGKMADPAAAITPTLLLGLVVLPCVTSALGRFWRYSASRRNLTASSGGMELT